mmetsp:Transcript_17962/g.29071  ORF Transcript_17962/g.29071 Transcript_17962/m.29071 type:complete len:121 (+) Transcript_17962:96-458(+)
MMVCHIKDDKNKYTNNVDEGHSLFLRHSLNVSVVFHGKCIIFEVDQTTFIIHHFLLNLVKIQDCIFPSKKQKQSTREKGVSLKTKSKLLSEGVLIKNFTLGCSRLYQHCHVMEYSYDEHI